MNNLYQTWYPLAGATRQDLRSLCKVLWHWQLCDNCDAGEDCQSLLCPWKKSKRLEPFFNFYRKSTSIYVPDLLPASVPSLRSHADLHEIIRTIKGNSQICRSELTETFFAQRARDNNCAAVPPAADQHRAFSLAVRAMTMVTSSVENQLDGLLESGTLPVTWQSDTSFSDFIQQIFPAREDIDFGSNDHGDHLVPIPTQGSNWSSVTAMRLKKVAGLELIPTDNLRNHLRLDLKAMTVEIYHHTSVLKEHLKASLGCEPHDDIGRAISEGNIPRDLALETLCTIKDVLFPLDSASQSLLRTLVSKKSFDPDCATFDSARHIRADESHIRFRYWAVRLTDLQDQIQNPNPNGFFERWMERRSGARYVMMATLGGVAIAVMLGALSLAVSIFQAWVGYQQWKHPVAA